MGSCESRPTEERRKCSSVWNRLELAASPQLLPDGDSLLFTLATAGAGQDAWDRARIVVQNLTSGERTTVVNGASEGRYFLPDIWCSR